MIDWNIFESYNKYSKYGKFPNVLYCYNLEDKCLNITSPTDKSVKRFKHDKKEVVSLRIYKLHGSLNCFSIHNSPNISKKKIFDQNRIYITNRAELAVSLTIKRKVCKQ